MDYKRFIFSTPSHSLAGSAGIALLRVVAGLLMLWAHGWPKYNNFLIVSAVFSDPYGLGSHFSLMLAIFAEVFCSLALIAGFATRLALIPLAFTMFTAYFVVHGADPFAMKELSLLYLLVYVVLMITGPGRFSADYYLYAKNTLTIQTRDTEKDGNHPE